MSYRIVEAIKAINWKDVTTRSLWTFLQAFLAVFLVTGELIINAAFSGDWNGLYALVITTSISATAAGLSALKTVILQVIKEIKTAA